MFSEDNGAITHCVEDAEVLEIPELWKMLGNIGRVVRDKYAMFQGWKGFLLLLENLEFMGNGQKLAFPWHQGTILRVYLLRFSHTCIFPYFCIYLGFSCTVHIHIAFSHSVAFVHNIIQLYKYLLYCLACSFALYCILFWLVLHKHIAVWRVALTAEKRRKKTNIYIYIISIFWNFDYLVTYWVLRTIQGFLKDYTRTPQGILKDSSRTPWGFPVVDFTRI